MTASEDKTNVRLPKRSARGGGEAEGSHVVLFPRWQAVLSDMHLLVAWRPVWQGGEGGQRPAICCTCLRCSKQACCYCAHSPSLPLPPCPPARALNLFMWYTAAPPTSYVPPLTVGLPCYLLC